MPEPRSKPPAETPTAATPDATPAAAPLDRRPRKRKEPIRNVPLRPRTILGKYRIVRRIGSGGFSRVYEAIDKVEGTHVALKVPRAEFVTEANLEAFRREVRTHAALDHPNILPIKNADLVGDVFVIAVPLGKGSIGDRMRRRMSIGTFLAFARQMVSAAAHAHAHRIVHCDIKPENFLLFGTDRVRLADFGIARIAQRRLKGSGSGTIGYISPEQAMGRPSYRSDVFSLGIVFWEMLSGKLPEYPLAWPYPGVDRLRRKVPADFIAFLRRATHPDPKKRFADATRMLAAFDKLEPGIKRFARGTRAKRVRATSRSRPATQDWRKVRFRQFQSRFGRVLGLDRTCHKCGGPMSEPMQCCPWCGTTAEPKRHESRFPDRCGRCHRGRKLDWRFCAWCHGKGFETVSTRTFGDKRYVAHCSVCRGALMPFSKYCPSCRHKVAKPWRIDGLRDKCPGCGWGVAKDFWSHCAWCSHGLDHGR